MHLCELTREGMDPRLGGVQRGFEGSEAVVGIGVG